MKVPPDSLVGLSPDDESFFGFGMKGDERVAIGGVIEMLEPLFDSDSLKIVVEPNEVSSRASSEMQFSLMDDRRFGPRRKSWRDLSAGPLPFTAAAIHPPTKKFCKQRSAIAALAAIHGLGASPQ